MALTEEKIIELSEVMFPEPVVETIINAGFCEMDIKHMTRDDVDQEFKKFNFGTRKSLWLFFKALKTDQNFEKEAYSTIPHMTPKNTKQATVNSQTQTDDPSSTETTSASVENEDISTTNEFHTGPVDRKPPTLLEASYVEMGTRPQVSASNITISDIFRTSESEPSVSSPNITISDVVSLHATGDTPCTSTFNFRAQYQAQIPEIPEKTVRTHQDTDTGILSKNKRGHTSYPKAQPDAKRCVGHQKARFFERFQNAPTKTLEKQYEPYPGTIPCPFPIDPSLKKYINVDRKAFMNHRPVFLEMIRNVCNVIYTNLGRKPTRTELLQVAKNLSQEYPVLQCEGKWNYAALYLALRKRISNLQYWSKVK